ncbi:Transposase [Shigella dysenteriae 1617]|uniref:Transposase n=1 Tax=Shigella dysenteriae 1617 TaxID=754093 RepID=A0A0A6ZXR9_SHIDY|nr:Transposase [Shigella dysenteriae 1617]
MASVNIHCPRCQSAQVYRHGQNPKGHDRFRCRDCHRVFQLTYTYEARKPGIKELITEMAFNGAGVRDTARTLKIGMVMPLISVFQLTYTYEARKPGIKAP